MAASDITRESTAPFAVVLATAHWDDAVQSWVRAWRAQSSTVELIVVDTGTNSEIAGHAPDDVRVVEAHRGTITMALNVGLEGVTAPRVLLQDTPRIPPVDFVASIQTVRAPKGAVLMGPGAPPAGVAQTALDILMLHLVPADAIYQAPNRWSTVPRAFWVLFPTTTLRQNGGLEAAEANFDLALQDACVRLGRGHNPVQLHRLTWPVKRCTTQEIADRIRSQTAARVRRLARRPDTTLEPGWSLASRTAVQAALTRDARGENRQRILEQLGSLDMRPMAEMPEWAPVARDQLRRMLVGLRQQQQRWMLEGLYEGLESVQARGVPELLARHPIRVGDGQSVLLPVERDDVSGLQNAICSFFRAGFSTQGTFAVVAGPATSSRLLRGLGPEWQSLELMAALAGSKLVMHPSSLTAPRAIRMLAPCSGWVPVERLQGEAWTLHARVTNTRPLRPPSRTPWPLDISRPVRLLAWPDWSSPDALRAFVQDMIHPLAYNRDVAMCLRVEPTDDSAYREARSQLTTLMAELLPDDHRIEVLLLPEKLDQETTRRLGLSVHAWIGKAPEPSFVDAVGAPVYSHPEEVLSVWEELSQGSTLWDEPTI